MKPIYFLRGRSALNYGLKILNLSHNDEILVPSLICDVIIKEFKKVGIKPVFYEVDQKFAADWNDIHKKYSKRIKGILMVHFFGKPQIIKKFKDYCKQKKIFLIEDNCHGFRGINNKNFHGDINIMSPYKIIQEIDDGGVLVVKKKLLKSNLNFNFKEKNSTTCFNLKKKIKNIEIINKIYRNLFKRPNYESLSISNKEQDYDNMILDKKTKKKIKNFSFNREKKLRLRRFNIWKNEIKKYKLKPYFNYTKSDNYILWYLVVKVTNFETRKKIYDWGWKNNVDIVSWPSFPNEIKKKIMSISFQENLFYFH